MILWKCQDFQYFWLSSLVCSSAFVGLFYHSLIGLMRVAEKYKLGLFYVNVRVLSFSGWLASYSVSMGNDFIVHPVLPLCFTVSYSLCTFMSINRYSPLFQYYEMSYGLNIEMHKQVSQDSLSFCTPHPHLEALHLSLVLSLLPSFALNQLENCENYFLRKISRLCCCYVNPLCDGLVERCYAVEVLIGSTNRIHFSTTDRWEYSALPSCPS